ncbi:MAG: DUF3971 domain-containing protein [Hyphomicrobiaceae bacterium]|nr:DUF3971 domain-containing protein [Hyphomicrobiaceae bacterium]
MARDLIKLTKKGRALVELHAQKGRDLVRHIPEPVQVGLSHLSRRSLVLTLEIFAGLFVVGSVVLALAYGRLNQGPMSLSSLVPVMEEAINREMADLEVKIDDAIIQRAKDGPGVNFRLRNIRLIDKQGAVVAQAPLAAIGLSGRALLSGRIAPGSVDFIGPRLLLFHTDEGGLSLSFSRAEPDRAGQGFGSADSGAQTPMVSGSRDAPAMVKPGMPIVGSAKEINITRTVAAAFDQARKRKTASSFLTRFGVRNAVVAFDRDGAQSFWQVPDFAIDLDHGKKHSIIMGQGEITSASGPWTFNFRTEQSSRKQRLTFSALIEDLVPSGIAANFPGFSFLESLNLPVSANTSIELSTSGDLLGAEAKLNVAPGQIVMPWDRKRPMQIDKGELHVRYDAEKNVIQIYPSKLSWGDSYATLSGSVSAVANKDGKTVWAFDLKADDAVLSATEFGLGPASVKSWLARGTYDRGAGRTILEKFVLQMDEGSITFAGSLLDAPGSPEIKLAGNVGAMPLTTLKQIWPKFLAGGAREWVGERVTAGHVSGGSFEIDLNAGELAKIEQGGDIADAAVLLDLAATGLEIHYIPKMPPVQTSDATLRIRGRRMEMDVPDGWVVLPTGRKVSLGAGSFTIDDLRPDPQKGEVRFTSKGAAEAVLELLDHDPLGYVKEAGLKTGDIGGITTGSFKIQMPLIKDLEFEHITLQGQANLNSAVAEGVFGGKKVSDGAISFNVSEKAIEARGEMRVNGVPAVLTWQRFFDASPERQPELRVSAVLDEDGREKLGLDINHMLRGPVPTVVSIEQAPSKPDRPKKVQLQADLRNAELVLANVGWSKPRGKAAVLSFEFGKGIEGNKELQNFRIVGDDIAIDGWISLGADEKPNAFFFPDFSFNVITHLEVKGRLREDKVWEVHANGPTYDGRQFFRSLFSAGQLSEDPQAGVSKFGLDLKARIGTIVGFFDTTAKDVSIDLAKRNGRLVKLQTRGQLNGTSPIAVQMVDGGQRERVLLAESQDAGSAFRLIGFYPRMEGGQASLRVALDAQGLAEKSGTLWARDFTILGDKVVSEVISNAGDDPGVSFNNRRDNQRVARRQRIPFNQLEVPFSVGRGQFVLHDSYINGPQLGATLRGTVDYKTKFVDLGGTFVPLYGLNSAFGSIPILGSLLVGRRGEGVLGITYAVKGPATDPRVRVNPMSMVAPGIFRQIFEFSRRSPTELAQPPLPGTTTQPSVSPFDPGRFDSSN